MSRRITPLLALLVLAAFSNARADTPPPAAAYNFVFIGDSITYGAGTSNTQTQAAPVVAVYYLGQALGANSVHGSNQGHSGHTTVDFLPGGGDFGGVESAAKQLQADHPGELVFSIMLGTNDCSSNGVTTGSPVSAANYARNLQQIIDKLLAEYPDSKFVINHPIWFSPNTHNAADYTGSACADRLKSYFPAMDTLIAGYLSCHPHHVFLGDTDAYDYFSIHFQTELNPEGGTFGTFYLHPNPAGAQSLGKFWAAAIAKDLKS